MRTKSQAFVKFQKFICYTKRKSENKLKRLHTDFGEEFANTVSQEFTFKEGIQWESSALYIPKRNKKAKRFNYTFMFLVRSILASILLSKIM